VKKLGQEVVLKLPFLELGDGGWFFSGKMEYLQQHLDVANIHPHATEAKISLKL
jgi:hypothetical protein